MDRRGSIPGWRGLRICGGTIRDYRSAFTVLELMVCSAVILLLLGLLLPAVMSVRESARQMECNNHLRQIGLAIQSYHSQARRLPAAWSSPCRSDRFVEAWSSYILPQLEQQTCAERLRSSAPEAWYRSSERAAELRLPIFLCPSDITEPFFALSYSDVDDYGPQSSAASRSIDFRSKPFNEATYLPSANYVGVYGTVEADEFELAVRSEGQTYGDGSIIDDTRVRLDDLQHGTAHTLLVGERTMSKVPSTWWAVDLDGDDAGCRVAGSAITHPNCEVCDECEFSSRHPAGSTFLWGDGHVTLINESIDTELYRGAAKRGY